MKKTKRPASSPSSTQLHQDPNLQHQQSSVSSIHNDGGHWKGQHKINICLYIIFDIYTYRYTCTYMYIYISNIGPHCNGLQYHPPCGWHSRCSHGRHGSKSIRAPDFTDDPMCSQCVPIVKCWNYVLSTWTRCSD